MKKPTIEEVVAYCKEKGYTFDPEYFFHYHESRGWMIGKCPMKNWHSACVTFQKNQDRWHHEIASAPERIERALLNGEKFTYFEDD
jgi:hypothetical protein